jgi:hypothetical protein
MDDHVVWLSSLYRDLMSDRPMPHSQTLAAVPGN